MAKPLNVGMIGYGFMGRGAFQRLLEGVAVLSAPASAGPQGDLRPQQRESRGLRQKLGL